jgi:hypothetical protein
MLDQMQRIFSIDALPSSSPISSYAIGTIDPIQFVTLQAHLAIGEECSLLVPIHLPLSLFIDPWFKDGYESGYPEGELDEEWSVPRIVNWTYNVFNDELYDELTWETLGVNPFDRTRRKVNFRSMVDRLLQTQQVANSRDWNAVASHYRPVPGTRSNSALHP